MAQLYLWRWLSGSLALAFSDSGVGSGLDLDLALAVLQLLFAAPTSPLPCCFAPLDFLKCSAPRLLSTVSPLCLLCSPLLCNLISIDCGGEAKTNDHEAKGLAASVRSVKG